MFRKILPKIPLSANASSKSTERFKKEIAPWLAEIKSNFEPYQKDTRLYGRIIYFNYERANVRDIHNVFKKTFDFLNGIVYEDDKAILVFEGIRLDMLKFGSWFGFEIAETNMTELNDVLSKKITCLLIEVGQLPIIENKLINIIWFARDYDSTF